MHLKLVTPPKLDLVQTNICLHARGWNEVFGKALMSVTNEELVTTAVRGKYQDLF